MLYILTNVIFNWQLYLNRTGWNSKKVKWNILGYKECYLPNVSQALFVRIRSIYY